MSKKKIMLQGLWPRIDRLSYAFDMCRRWAQAHHLKVPETECDAFLSNERCCVKAEGTVESEDGFEYDVPWETPQPAEGHYTVVAVRGGRVHLNDGAQFRSVRTKNPVTKWVRLVEATTAVTRSMPSAFWLRVGLEDFVNEHTFLDTPMTLEPEGYAARLQFALVSCADTRAVEDEAWLRFCKCPCGIKRVERWLKSYGAVWQPCWSHQRTPDHDERFHSLIEAVSVLLTGGCVSRYLCAYLLARVLRGCSDLSVGYHLTTTAVPDRPVECVALVCERLRMQIVCFDTTFGEGFKGGELKLKQGRFVAKICGHQTTNV